MLCPCVCKDVLICLLLYIIVIIPCRLVNIKCSSTQNLSAFCLKVATHGQNLMQFMEQVSTIMC